MKIQDLFESKFEFSEKTEEWIEANKDRFRKQYGDDWEQILYATATKMQKEGKL